MPKGDAMPGTALGDVGTSPAIDLLSAGSFAHGQPHEQFRWLREHDPVHWHEEPGGPGFWAVTRYRDVKFVGRTPTIFSSQPTILIPDGLALDPDHQMFLTSDPPRHTAQRKLISSRFIPRAARLLRPRIRELARSIVDGVIEGGECELAEEVAGLMPSYVLADLLGIPLDDGVALYPLTEAIHAAPGSQPPEAAMHAVTTMFNYAHQVWDNKRRQPTDDIASMIANGEIDGVPIDETDFNLYFILLVDAGGDTTRNLVTGGIISPPGAPGGAGQTARRCGRHAAIWHRGDAPLGEPRGVHAPDREGGGPPRRHGDRRRRQGRDVLRRRQS